MRFGERGIEEPAAVWTHAHNRVEAIVLPWPKDLRQLGKRVRVVRQGGKREGVAVELPQQVVGGNANTHACHVTPLDLLILSQVVRPMVIQEERHRRAFEGASDAVKKVVKLLLCLLKYCRMKG